MEWTLKKALDMHRDYLVHELRVSENTVKAYCRDTAEFARFLSEKGLPDEIDRIDPLAVRAFLAELHGENTASSIGPWFK